VELERGENCLGWETRWGRVVEEVTFFKKEEKGLEETGESPEEGRLDKTEKLLGEKKREGDREER